MHRIHVEVMKSVTRTSTPITIDVNLILLEKSVKQRLMIVMEIPVRTMLPVKMESTLSPVNAQLASLETIVKQMSMTVMETSV